MGKLLERASLLREIRDRDRARKREDDVVVEGHACSPSLLGELPVQGLGQAHSQSAHGQSPERQTCILVSIMTLNELESEALKLDPKSRARLAESLLASLDDLSEAETEQRWLDEAERREREWDAGRVEGIPAEHVLTELRARR